MSSFSSRAGDEYTIGFPVDPMGVHPKFRALYVGGAGDLVLIAENDTATNFDLNFGANTYELGHNEVLVKNVPAGTVLKIRGFMTVVGTTATNLVGLV